MRGWKFVVEVERFVVSALGFALDRPGVRLAEGFSKASFFGLKPEAH